MVVSSRHIKVAVVFSNFNITIKVAVVIGSGNI